MTSLHLGDKQLQSIREATGTVNLWHGAIRSGKTIGSLIRWMLFIPDAPLGGHLIIVGRTRDSVWRNIITPLQDPKIMGAMSAHVVGNYGAPTVDILGRRVIVMGASDVKAETTLRGLTVAGAYVDEVTTLPEMFFVQLLGRMSVKGAKLFGTTNPDNPAHWLKANYLDQLGKLPHWRVWHFTMDDNPSLEPEYIEQKKLEFTGLWYRRFILGEWVAGEGAVYPMWDPARHVVPWESMPDMYRLFAVGVDYGTQNATVGILLGMGYDRKLYLVDEWRYDKNAHGGMVLSDFELAAQFVPWLRGRHTPQPCLARIEWVCVDPAAASFKVQLHRDGVQGVTDAENDVAWGLKMFASLLTTGQMVVSDRCPGLIAEIAGYSWDAKKALQGVDAPMKVADHSLDAARYAVATTEALWRGELATLLAA